MYAEVGREQGKGEKKMKQCKFCGKPINVLKWIGDDREYHCGECVRYCMDKCELALNSNTSWHKEPCLSCEHNPYKIMHKWDGEKWTKQPL